MNEATLIKATHKNGNLTTDIDPVFWSKESFKLAIEKVYLNGELKGSVDKENALPVPENYGKESKKVGEHQVALVGNSGHSCPTVGGIGRGLLRAYQLSNRG